MSDQILQEVGGDMDIFKKLGSKIPGFQGMIERSEYRDADKLLRDTIAKAAEQENARVSDLQRQFISAGEIAYVDDLEAASVKLRTFADKVRFAARGYAGPFDATNVNSEELKAVYEYDGAMMDQLDGVTRAVDNIQASIGTDGLPAAIRNLITLSQQMLDTFSKREEVMKGIAS